MGIVAGQENQGQINGATTFTVTLPSATSASNLVVVFVYGNTTVTTPAGFTLRASQVNAMGHYVWDAAGGASSWVFTNAAGQLSWYAAEVTTGVFVSGSGVNVSSAATTYTTPVNTPTAGPRMIFGSLGATGGTIQTRTLSGWTGGFIEHADSCVAASDDPMGGVAVLSTTADGVTGFSTTGTYSAAAMGNRSALIASFNTPLTGTSTPAPAPQVVTRITRFRSTIY